MTDQEKAKAYDEALERAKALYEQAKKDGNPIWSTYEYLLPELRESEDEKMMNQLHSWMMEFGGAEEYAERVFQWLKGLLEKQKEQNEELVYRINGLMQDYIKEGKDDEEKEHRLKCYQLFWDALEDENFFEQKEQKPVEKLKAYDSMDDLIADALIDEIENSELPKSAKHNRIHWIKTHRQKLAEWSEEDTLTIDAAIYWLERRLRMERANDISTGCSPLSMMKTVERLKSLRPSWKPSEEQMEAFRGFC